MPLTCRKEFGCCVQATQGEYDLLDYWSGELGENQRLTLRKGKRRGRVLLRGGEKKK